MQRNDMQRHDGMQNRAEGRGTGRKREMEVKAVNIDEVKVLTFAEILAQKKAKIETPQVSEVVTPSVQEETSVQEVETTMETVTSPRAPSSFSVGQKIIAQWGGTEDWYLGKIEAAHQDGTYDVLFDDGDREVTKPASNIMEPPTEEPANEDAEA